MDFDNDTLGYFLYMEEQEQEQDKDYSFRCNNEDNKENEVSIWQK